MSRILLIEDNRTNRKLAVDILRRAQHSVCAVETADEGIAQTLREPFDLIIMDVQLPGTDGLTAVRILRASTATRELPILAATAYAMRGDEERILAAGCDGYIAKPISYKELLAAVTRLVDSRRAGRVE